MKSQNPIINFFREVGMEIKKITWPTRQEAVKYTFTVVVITLIVALILGLFDFGFQQLLEKFVFKK
ncbi:MAG: preprotein translocase subunit SecE [Candidatus Paceibacterota bacterium]